MLYTFVLVFLCQFLLILVNALNVHLTIEWKCEFYISFAQSKIIIFNECIYTEGKALTV